MCFFSWILPFLSRQGPVKLTSQKVTSAWQMCFEFAAAVLPSLMIP